MILRRHLIAAMRLADARRSGPASALGSEFAYAYFRIIADDLPLDDITRDMGIAPTECWRRGTLACEFSTPW